MKTLTTTPEALRNLTESDELTAAREKLTAIQLKRNELAAKRAELVGGTNRLLEKSKEEALLARVDALLAGGQEDFENRIAVLSRQSTAVQRDIADLDTACEIQQKLVYRLEDSRNREVCRSAAGEHRRLVRNIAEAVLTVLRANSAEQVFLDSFQAAGIDTTGILDAMAFRRLGSTEDAISRNSTIGEFLNEIVEKHIMSESEITKALQ